MKHMVNFRLGEKTLNILATLEERLHYSKTAIVEKAKQFYAKKELAKQKLILEYAGILNKQDADAMLTMVHENKYNKEIQIEL